MAALMSCLPCPRSIMMATVLLSAMCLPGCGGTADPASPSAMTAARKLQDADTHRDGGLSYTFNGICDGSAAVKLADDSILVAYDELNTLFVYPSTGGNPTARRDLNAMLHLKTSAEIDLEAATIDGDRIWWAGSHSQDSRGRYAANRHLLFATNIPAPDLTDLRLTNKPVDLTKILLRSAAVRKLLPAEADNRAPKEGGINIEGIAAANDGRLLVGFRAPLSKTQGLSGRALLVTLEPDGDDFAVTRINRLDLDNRGIRDIISDDGAYLIIAGAVNSGGKSALYRWNGSDNSPRLIRSLDSLNPEAMLRMAKRWLILSDDGKKERADTESRDGMRSCDRIRKKNSRGEAHPGVFFRALLIDVIG